MPAGLWGLHVRFGDRFTEPSADFTCRCGFSDAAAGAAAVARFAAEVAAEHKRSCRFTERHDSGKVR